MVSCYPDITYPPFRDATIITSEILLPPDGNKIGFNLLDENDLTIQYIIDTITNSPAGCQLPTQTKNNVWIFFNNGETPITEKGHLVNSIAIRLNLKTQYQDQFMTK